MATRQRRVKVRVVYDNYLYDDSGNPLYDDNGNQLTVDS